MLAITVASYLLHSFGWLFCKSLEGRSARNFLAGCSVGRWKDEAQAIILAGCFVGRWKDGAPAIFLTGYSVGRWKDGALANFASGCFAGRWKDGVAADFWARFGR